ncbi:MAG: hypothetical protein H0X27_06880 [Caulobacteraceae bacterium]|nr:hypothetical protein [Caulobacteraceae bacterium]
MLLQPARFSLGLAACAALGLTASAAPRPDPAPRSCFYFTQWQGWSSPSPDVLYLRINVRDIYRVDLSAGSSRLQQGGSVHLVSKIRGPSTICSAIDLDLAVADDNGFSTPLIARSITKLTPEEAAAIPAKFRP